MPRHLFPCGLSRSGTTLLTTVLDAHPAISMGYELMPAGLPPRTRFAELLDRAIAEGDGQPRKTGNLLRKWGEDSAGVFVKRCARACVDPPDLRSILDDLGTRSIETLDDAEGRATLSMAVVAHKMAGEGTTIGGHKIGPERAAAVLRDLDTAVVFIVRDPRDTAASQAERGFPGEVEDVARSWRRFVSATRTLGDQHPDRTFRMRYEDLVAEPETTLRSMCDTIDLPFDAAMLRFFDSKASIHRDGQRHANAEALSRGFFTTNVGRWHEDLTDDEVVRIERLCAAEMDQFAYERATPERGLPLRERLADAGHALRRRAGRG